MAGEDGQPSGREAPLGSSSGRIVYASLSSSRSGAGRGGRKKSPKVAAEGAEKVLGEMATTAADSAITAIEVEATGPSAVLSMGGTSGTLTSRALTSRTFTSRAAAAKTVVAKTTTTPTTNMSRAAMAKTAMAETKMPKATASPASESSTLSPFAAPWNVQEVLAGAGHAGGKEATASPPPRQRARAPQPVRRPDRFDQMTEEELIACQLAKIRRRFAAPTHGLAIEAVSARAYKATVHVPIEDADFPFDIGNENRAHLAIEQGAAPHALTLTICNEHIPPPIRARINRHMVEHARTVAPPAEYMPVLPLIRLLLASLESWMVAPSLYLVESSSVRIITSIQVPPPSSSPSKVEAGGRAAPEAPTFASDALVKRSIAVNASAMPLLRRDEESPTACEVGALRFAAGQLLRFDAVPESAKADAVRVEVAALTVDNVAVATVVAAAVALACARCKARTDVPRLLPGVDTTIPCAKCKQHMLATFEREPTMLAAAPEARSKGVGVLGYLRMKRATPVDLLPLTVQVACASCCPTAHLANTVQIRAVAVGEAVALNCPNCFKRIAISWSGPLWHLGEAAGRAPRPPSARGSGAAAPLMVVGKPLPNFGACEHFKKSFRWFRYPCCGGLYPCEQCHNAAGACKETILEWASRQVCGCCSREFATSIKVCECGQVPGGPPRHTAHWEGGTGIRDKALMSRKDQKKYTGMQKTTSRKAQGTPSK